MGQKGDMNNTYLSRDFLAAEEQRALAWLLKHRSHADKVRVPLRTGEHLRGRGVGKVDTVSGEQEREVCGVRLRIRIGSCRRSYDRRRSTAQATFHLQGLAR